METYVWHNDAAELIPAYIRAVRKPDGGSELALHRNLPPCDMRYHPVRCRPHLPHRHFRLEYYDHHLQRRDCLIQVNGTGFR